jgi:hypothetical protein
LGLSEKLLCPYLIITTLPEFIYLSIGNDGIKNQVLRNMQLLEDLLTRKYKSIPHLHRK